MRPSPGAEVSACAAAPEDGRTPKKVKILIAIPKPTLLFPSGPAYVLACLKRAGFHAEGCVVENALEFAGRLRDCPPDVVMTGGLCSQFAGIREILNAARTISATTVLGGGIVTSEPELMHRALRPDYSILGQAEETAVELARSLQLRTRFDVPGTARLLTDGSFHLAPARPEIVELDALPFPDYDALGLNRFLDAARPSDDVSLSIHDEPRQYLVVDSRSCPYRCTFCYHPSGDIYRQRSVGSIMREVEWAVTHFRANIIFFIGELLTAGKTRLFELCARMRELRAWAPQVVWQACVRVDNLSAYMLAAMKESGCYIANYGFESHSQAILDSMQKRIRVEQIDRAVAATQAARIALSANFLLGSRDETPETAAASFDYARRHPEAAIAVKHIYVAPRSPDYEYCVQRGVIHDRLDHIMHHWQDALNFTRMPARQWRRMMVQVLKLGYFQRARRAVARRRPAAIEYTCPHCRATHRLWRYEWRPLRTKRVICRSCCQVFLLTGLPRLFADKILGAIIPDAAWPYPMMRAIASLSRL